MDDGSAKTTVRLALGISATACTVLGIPGVRLDYPCPVPDGKGGEVRLPAALVLFADAEGRHFGVSAIGGNGRDIDEAVARAAAGRRMPQTTASILKSMLEGTLSGRPFADLGPDGADETLELRSRDMVRDLVAGAVAASGLPLHLRQAFAAISRWRWKPTREIVALLTDPDPAMDRARAYCIEFPLLAEYQSALSEGEMPLGPGRHAEPDFSPALRARLSALDWRIVVGDDPGRGGYEAFLDLARAIPVDWFPRDAATLRAFRVAAMLCEAAGPMIDPGTAVRASRGDWPAFAGRALAAARRMRDTGNQGDGGAAPGAGAPPEDSLNRTCEPLRGMLADMIQAVRLQLAIPLIARLSGESDIERIDTTEAERLARDLCYGDRSLVACIEACAWWHDHDHEIQSAMPSDVDERSWPALRPATAIGNLEVVPLASGRDVVEEGSPRPDRNGVPGLHHCVGGVRYRNEAASGTIHLVSVRRPLPGGSYERLATGSIRIDPEDGPSLGQLLGHRNASPPADVEAAIRAYLRMPMTVPPPREATTADPMLDACGYDPLAEGRVEQALAAWSPLLPRHLRGLSPEAFAEALGLASTDPGASRTP